jgi:hypothetical protein
VNESSAIALRKRNLTALILAAVFASPTFAGGYTQWDNLRELRRGQRIGVVQSDLTLVEGRFEAFSGSAISLRADREILVEKDKVIRVYRRPRGSRGLRALIGGAIGIAAGIVLTATVGDRYRNEGQDIPAGLWVAGGAGIGAAVGALTGGGYKTVYQRSPVPAAKSQGPFDGTVK